MSKTQAHEPSEVPPSPILILCCSMCAKRTFLVGVNSHLYKCGFNTKSPVFSCVIFLSRKTQRCAQRHHVLRDIYHRAIFSGRNFCKYTSGNDAHNLMEVIIPQWCPSLCDPIDGSSSVHGILQAGTLEWVAIPFSSHNLKVRH